MGNDRLLIIFNDFYVVDRLAGLNLEDLILLVLFYGDLAKVKVILGDVALPLKCLEGGKDVFLLKLTNEDECEFATKIMLVNRHCPRSVGG